jgi:5-oxoprolinase (ATP-hydrolysing)
MMSSGGMTAAEKFQGKDAILSGPAGGVVGMVETAADAGFSKRHRLRHGRHLDRRRAFRGRLRTRLRHRGGGRAHPRADDAHPHGCGGRRVDPACRTGPLPRRPRFGGRKSRPRLLPSRRAADVTDANVMLGKLRPEFFPRVFGPDQDAALDADAVAAKFAEIAEAEGKTPEEVAEGFLTIAVENMANAIKKIRSSAAMT